MEVTEINNVTELLAHLRRLDVEIWSDKDRLKCRAPTGVMTTFLQEQIARWKPELLEFLRSTQRALLRVDIPIRKVSRDFPIPASFGQQRLWFLQELAPDSYAYNIPGAVRICGPLDIPSLARVLNAIVQRHETLRTSFALSFGSLIQVIGPGTEVTLEPVDLSDQMPFEQEQRVRELISTEARRPFPISTGPHFRVSLVRLNEEEWVLIIIQHHIISDGWSLGIFVREIGELYSAFVSGQPSPLQPIAIQYADYAFWQHQWLSGTVLQEQLRFWKHHLEGPLPVLNLPTDRPRPRLQTQNGALVSILLPVPLSDALKAFSQREGVTLFMTLMATFKVLLCRYTNQTDLIVGTSNGNRSHLETEALIGFFVNTLALRTDLSGNPTVREVLKRIRHAALSVYDNQQVPFERLVEEIQPVRDLSRSPIFQVMLTLHNAPKEKLELQNLTLSGVECDIGTSKFELTLNATDIGSGLAVVMEYNTNLFDASTIRRMLSHWRMLVEQFVVSPDRRISELALLSVSERMRIIEEWNATSAEDSANATICSMLDTQARCFADRIAVECGEVRLTYHELRGQSDELARRLRGNGARRGIRVGICMERSPGLLVAMLGILKSGAAYVPLDINLPAKRLDYVVRDSQILLIIADRQTAKLLPVGSASVMIPEEHPEQESDLCEPESPNSADTAYLMYTSGSTGQPKSVAIPHRAVVNFLASMQKEPGFGVDDVMLAVTPITFDISVLELLLPLKTGGRVVIADRPTAQDPNRLSRAITVSRATVMQATPATWKMLLDAGWSGSRFLKVLSGGDSLPADLADQLLHNCGELWNMYGPTESTVWSSVQRILPGEFPLSIGRPIRNTQIYILDSHMQPMPVGVPGELYIGGHGLADGYVGRPGLTAEKFVPNPYAATLGKRLYRTGDLARFLPGGRIELLGRLDTQVKLRGFRIELEEIETVLRTVAYIRDAVVMVHPDTQGPRLVAYVVTAESDLIQISDLRSRLSEQLPAEMLPSEFIVMDSLPLTPAGKIDRRSLPIPAHHRPELNVPFAAPRNEMEHSIYEIWNYLLPISNIGIHDNFFDLGGHSLLLAQMRRMIEENTGVDMSLIQLFQYPSIAAIGDFLKKTSKTV